MANELLDFVMSVVRDPAAAAQYAADPGQAIANANLTDVTSVDVNNLIPVVAESLSSAMPSAGTASVGDFSDANVWASGAATAAFDAFDGIDQHLPTQVIDDSQAVVHDTVSDMGPGDLPPMDFDLGSSVPGLVTNEDPGLQLDHPIVDDIPVMDAGPDDSWGHQLVDDHQQHGDPGSDLFI